MKVYTVWSGEYSDRGMHAVFLDKEKADKYAELQAEINPYDGYWVQEYDTMDDQVSMTSTTQTYWVAQIACKDHWNCDHTEKFHSKGDILTDWMYEEEMKEQHVDSIDDLYFNADTDLDSFSTEKQIVAGEGEPTYIEKLDDMITVYAKESYKLARKICIEQYQIYTQQELADNGEI